MGHGGARALVAVSTRTSVAGLILSLHESRPSHPGPKLRHLADTSLWHWPGSLCHPKGDKYDTICPPWAVYDTLPILTQSLTTSPQYSLPSSSLVSQFVPTQPEASFGGCSDGGQWRNAGDWLKEFFALSSPIRLVRNQPQADWLSTDHLVATSLVTNPPCAYPTNRQNTPFATRHTILP